MRKAQQGMDNGIIMWSLEADKVQAVKKLQQDLLNSSLHCFVSHSNYSLDYCKLPNNSSSENSNSDNNDNRIYNNSNKKQQQQSNSIVPYLSIFKARLIYMQGLKYMPGSAAE